MDEALLSKRCQLLQLRIQIDEDDFKCKGIQNDGFDFQ